MNQVMVYCENDTCYDQILNRVCLNKNCNNNRLICERCLNDHKNHIDDCLLISDIPQKIIEISQQKQDAEEITAKVIENFLKKIRTQIEQKFAFQHCPIFQVQLTQNITNWTRANFHQFSKQVSQLDFESQYFDKVLSEKINHLNSIQFDEKQYQRLFVPTQIQTKNKIIIQGLAAKLNKNYGMTNFQPNISREHVYKSITIKDNELISGTDIKKLSILTPNLLDLAQDEIKLVFKYEGGFLYQDGKNKFGLYIGTLTDCCLSENIHERNLILINDQAKYVQKDIQLLNKEELKELFLDNDMNLFMLVLDKTISNQSLSLINLRTNKKVKIQLENKILQAYFCFSLSCHAKIKFI